MSEVSDNIFWRKVTIYAGAIFLLSMLFNPFFDNAINERIGAICSDGWRSHSSGSGTCSWHGGVSEWLYKETPYSTPFFKKIIGSLIFSLLFTMPAVGIAEFLKERMNNKD